MTATTTAPSPSLLATTLRLAQSQAGVRTRRVLATALALSFVLHVALTLWPVDIETAPDATPLTATSSVPNRTARRCCTSTATSCTR